MGLDLKAADLTLEACLEPRAEGGVALGIQNSPPGRLGMEKPPVGIATATSPSAMLSFSAMRWATSSISSRLARMRVKLGLW